MYYYLAIVKKKDILNGNFIPSYILCKRLKPMQNRADWIICQRERLEDAYPILLVGKLVGHEDMIDFMSKYRTRDKSSLKNGHKTKAIQKYSPEGGLFWFPCNIEGVQKGPALFIKRVPDKSIKGDDQGFARLKEYRSRKIPLNQLFVHDDSMFDLIYSHIQPKLYQQRSGAHARQKGNRNSAG